MNIKRIFMLFILAFFALLLLAVSVNTVLGHESEIFYRISATLFYVQGFTFFLAQFILNVIDGKGGGPKYA